MIEKKRITMNKRIAVDTNILLYTHFEEDTTKTNIALDILDLSPMISSQVISEYINVLKRQMKLSKREIIKICTVNFEACLFHSANFGTLQKAKELIDKYDFQIFDSLIVASALESDCNILYSEDMQNGLVVEKQLVIVNPFVVKE